MHVQVSRAVKRFTSNGAEFADGRSENFDAVVFATGYRSNVPCWLKVIDGSVGMILIFVCLIDLLFINFAGKGFFLTKRWVAKKSISERVERWKRIVCRRLHKEGNSRSFHGCKENSLWHGAKLECKVSTGVVVSDRKRKRKAYMNHDRSKLDAGFMSQELIH